MENKLGPYYISIEHLRAGMYVHLDLRWVEHNFSLNSFKIKSESQVAEIKSLGLKRIRIDPARSTIVVPPIQESSPHAGVALDVATGDTNPVVLHPVNQARLAYLNQQRNALDQCERQFAKAASSLRNIISNFEERPHEAHQEATDLVQEIVKTILSDKDIAIHLMSDKADGEEMYFHALNVSVLAMMLAKELGMSPLSIEHVGIGCIFHDIGKTKIPDRVLRATMPTRTELNLVQQHCAYGSAIGVRLGLSREALNVIMQHHECMDGTGYPHMLIGDEISPLARIAAIVNVYDHHCNHANPSNSLTPYEALSHMYANERSWFDPKFLNVFIHCMGVYPPGTLVRLTDETLGLVIASNFGKPLRPRILIFDPSVPKSEAATLDLLKEPDLSVKQSLRPRDVSRDVYEYLSPRTHMTYFFNGTPKPDKT
jgi:putative nucleotidyltransferase with HDIG domain